jgi:hypothetical protein
MNRRPVGDPHAAWRAQCLKAATSPWRVRYAEALVARVRALSTRDLRRLSQLEFERLTRGFGWLVLDENPPQ